MVNGCKWWVNIPFRWILLGVMTSVVPLRPVYRGSLQDFARSLAAEYTARIEGLVVVKVPWKLFLSTFVCFVGDFFTFYLGYVFQPPQANLSLFWVCNGMYFYICNIYIYIYLPTYLSIYLSIYPSIYLSIFFTHTHTLFQHLKEHCHTT